MRIIICIFFISLVFVPSISGQEKTAVELKSRLRAFPITGLPYKFKQTDSGSKPFTYFPQGFTKISYRNYLDFNGTVESPKHSWVHVFIYRYFKPVRRNFVIVAVEMFTDTFKHILVTCDTCGNYIDHLEVGIGVFHSGRIASKQWKIDENLNVFVWQIKAVNSKLITWQEYDKNGVMEGQRIDSYYRIDLNGKFLKTREVKYTTRNYPFTFFDFPKSFLWDNKDTVISDEKIFR